MIWRSGFDLRTKLAVFRYAKYIFLLIVHHVESRLLTISLYKILPRPVITVRFIFSLVKCLLKAGLIPLEFPVSRGFGDLKVSLILVIMNEFSGDRFVCFCLGVGEFVLLFFYRIVQTEGLFCYMKIECSMLSPEGGVSYGSYLRSQS